MTWKRLAIRLELPPRVICSDRPLVALGPCIVDSRVIVGSRGADGLSRHITGGGNSRRTYLRLPTENPLLTIIMSAIYLTAPNNAVITSAFRERKILTRRPAEASDIIIAGIAGVKFGFSHFSHLIWCRTLFRGS